MVIPLKPKEKTPVGNEWQHRRYQESEIDGVFPDDANLGVLTGEPSGDLIDIDLDSIRAVRLAPQFLPKTEAIFGRPGKVNSHWLYVVPGNSEAPDAERLRSKKFEDIPGGGGVIAEIRVDARMTMIPPSIHPSGEPLTGSTENPATTDAESIWKALSHLATACLIGENWDRLRNQHHDFTLALAGGLAKSGVPVDDAEHLLRAVLVDVGDPDVESRLRNLRDTYRKYDNGEAVTGWTTVAEYLDPKRMFRIRNDWLKTKTKDFSFTDEGNAQRLILRFGHRIRYVHALKSWFVWDGSRWRQDDNETVLAFAREVGVSLAELSESSGDKKTKSWSITTRNLPRLRAMVDVARTDPAVKKAVEDFDRNPNLLNLANGTLNLRTGASQPHDFDDFITQRADVVWRPAPVREPDAPLTMWERFLVGATEGWSVAYGGAIADPETAQRGADMRAFLQRLAGSFLVGRNPDEIFVWLWGPAGSGKSTFADAVRNAMGQYGIEADPATLLERRQAGGPRPDIIRLRGARLVTVDEPADLRIDAAFLKRSSGGSSIVARGHHANDIVIRPTWTTVVTANHPPKVDAQDSGVWRRLIAVKFPHIVPAAERSDGVKVSLSSAGEAIGIFRWMANGYQEWSRIGLAVPDFVRADTQATRDEVDDLAAFLDEECVIGTDQSATVGAVYACYQRWAESSGINYPKTKRAVSQALLGRGELREAGVEQRSSTAGRTWFGLGLRAVSERAPAPVNPLLSWKGAVA